MGKRIIRLLLAFALLAAVVQPAAVHGEVLTAEEKYNKLVEQGIFEGYPDGEAHLDHNMTRAQAAKIIALILSLKENPSGANIYIDLDESHWALGYIGAATAAGILEGYGNGIFDPSSDVTIEQLAKIMVEALDLEVDEDAKVEGASDWAGKYVKAALDAGLIPEQSDYTKPASRDLLVDVSYAANEQLQANAEETGWMTSAEQTGARKVQITFQGKADPDAASIVIERIGNENERTPVGIERLEWNADEGSVTAILNDKAETGSYIVSFTVRSDEKTVTSEYQFNMEAETLERIVLGGSDQLPQANDVAVPFSLYNQFGEEMDERPEDIRVISIAPRAEIHPELNLVVLDLAELPKETFVAVVILADNVSADRIYKIGDIRVLDRVSTAGFYDASGNRVSTLKKGETAYLLLTPLDQYGNPFYDVDMDWLNENLQVTAVVHDFRPLTLPKQLEKHPKSGLPSVSVTGGSYLRDTVITVTITSKLGKILAQESITVEKDAEILPPPPTPASIKPSMSVDPNSIVTVMDATYTITTYVTVTSQWVTDLHYMMLPESDPEPDVEDLLQISGTTATSGRVKTSGTKRLELAHVYPNDLNQKFKLYVVGSAGDGLIKTQKETVEIDTDSNNVFRFISISGNVETSTLVMYLDYTPQTAPVTVYYVVNDTPLPTVNSPDDVIQLLNDSNTYITRGLKLWGGDFRPPDRVLVSSNPGTYYAYVVLEYRGVLLMMEETLTL